MTYWHPRRAPRALAACAAFSLWLITTTAFAQTFAGTFKGDGLTLVLKAVLRQSNRYSGTVSLGGQTFPATGRFSGQKFSGTFQTGGQSFPFSLRRQGNDLVLTSGNTSYHLRSPAGAANPLAKPLANPLAQKPMGGMGQPTRVPRPIANDKSGYLGIVTMMDANDQMRVFMTVEGGPAARAGLQRGDIIVAVGGQHITSDEQMLAFMRGPVGSRVPMKIARESPNGTKPLNVTIVRGLMPTAPGGNGAPGGAIDRGMTGQMGGAPSAGNGGAGYLGLATMMDDNNQMRVFMTVEGGPATRAGLQRGDIIRSIDGQAITTDEQMRARLTGPVGSRVVMQVERDTQNGPQQFNVTIVRGTMPTPEGGNPGGGGPGGGDPGAGVPNGLQGRNNIGVREPVAQRPLPQRFAQAKPLPKRASAKRASAKRAQTSKATPAVAAGRFPTPIQVGTRLVYNAGDAVVQGASSRVVQSSDGSWIDDQGRHWRQDQLESSGGVGYTTLDIVQTTPSFIAADMRSFLVGFNNAISLSGTNTVTGNSTTLGSSWLNYWIHPARLARMRRGRNGGHQVSRVRYKLGGQTLDALSISDTSPTAYANEIYDLKTGLLLSSSRSNRGGDQRVLEGNNQLGNARGATVMSHLRLVSTRKRQLPWANSPAPGWATAGRRLNYQGKVENVMFNSGLPPLPPSGASFSCLIQRVIGGCVLVNTSSSYSNGAGLPPSESQTLRCYATTSIGSLWIPPGALGRLRPNQVIDQDPVTRFRVTYLGVQNGAAIISEQGPIEQFLYAYNPQNGMLVGFDATSRPNNIGEQRRQFRLQG